jgi:hypothetical protein
MIMQRHPVLLPLLLVLFCSFQAFPQTPQSEPDTDKEVIKVIHDFWTALGVFDVEGMTQTFDWPVTIVEASAKETTHPRALMSPNDLDIIIKKERPPSNRSEFYGTKLSGFKVELQNPTLALVTYTAKLPTTTDPHKPGSFNAIAIVRKTSLGNAWKIIFMTVPK